MTYDEAMEGHAVSYSEARREVCKHNADWLEFLCEHGHKAEYDSADVMAWLGY